MKITHSVSSLVVLMLLVAAAVLAGCVPQPAQQPPVQVAIPSLEFESIPTTVTAGQEFTMSWKVSGNSAQIPHTAVHYGPQSVADPKGPSDYPKATPFQCQENPCSIPNSFSGQLKIDEPGTYYLRAHIILGGKNFWSDEKVVTVVAPPQPVQAPSPPPTQIQTPSAAAPSGSAKVAITSIPSTAAANQQIAISWKVDGINATIPHAAVHYGPSSVPTPTAPADYPFQSAFFCTDRPCTVPKAFQSQISIADPGTYYLRAHAVINGQNVWSDEKVITVETPPATPVGTVSYGY